MPTSDRKIEANRRNARRSTGPRTPEGKRASSQNALTHGILARETVISHGDYQESEEEFATLLQELYDDRKPQGPLEALLVQQIAICYWRLRRILHVDSLEFGKTLAKLEQEPETFNYLGMTHQVQVPSLPPTEKLDVILRYEKAIQGQLSRSLAHLERLQAQRRQRTQADDPPSEQHEICETKPPPSAHPVDGRHSVRTSVLPATPPDSSLPVRSAPRPADPSLPVTQEPPLRAP